MVFALIDLIVQNESDLEGKRVESHVTFKSALYVSLATSCSDVGMRRIIGKDDFAIDVTHADVLVRGLPATWKDSDIAAFFEGAQVLVMTIFSRKDMFVLASICMRSMA